MAITKMRHIKESGGSNGLKRSIAYIMNPDKTENGLLVGGNAGTTVQEVFDVMMETKHHFGKTKGRQGYHFVISWKPGDITKELAYQVTGEFCKRYLGDDYDHVYSVHTDQDHIHAHIVFNSVNRRDGYKYRYEKGDWEKFIQPVTDAVCREHGLKDLSMQRTGERALQYAEHQANKEGLPTLTRIIRADIDRMILRTDSFEDFLSGMRKLGYKIREGKYVTYLPPGFTKGRRDKNLGSGYSREEIRWRIRHKEMEPPPSPVMDPAQVRRMDRRLQPYLSRRLSNCQYVYVIRLGRAAHYLESKNPYAVKWRTVRKDAMEIRKLFEECMYLLEHDIHDLDTLREVKTSSKKERNLVRRIMERSHEQNEIIKEEKVIQEKR